MLYYCHDEISMFLLQSSNQISNQDIQNICIQNISIVNGFMRYRPCNVVTRDKSTYNQFALRLISDSINISNVIPCSLWPVIARERLMGTCKIWYPFRTLLLLHTGNFIVVVNSSGRNSITLSLTDFKITITHSISVMCAAKTLCP